MHTVQYQRWNPSQSPVRVEFPPQLLGEIVAQGGREARGSLYGILLGSEIRIIAERSDASVRERRRDEELLGLEKVGIFVRRPKGEVFLTESDLERFEGQRAAVALVIAGDRAGFFVRQADGSIQGIRSHEEFSVTPAVAALREGASVAAKGGASPRSVSGTQNGTASAPVRGVPARQPRSGVPPVAAATRPQVAISAPARSLPPHAQPVRTQALRPVKTPAWPRVTAAFLAIPLAALAYLEPLAPPVPVELRMQQAGANVAISWRPAAMGRGGEMEIADGSSSVKVDLQPNQSSLTYAPHSAMLAVRIKAEGGMGGEQSDVATLAFAAPPPPPPSPADGLKAQIATLETEASRLQESLEAGSARIDTLQQIISRLTRGRK